LHGLTNKYILDCTAVKINSQIKWPPLDQQGQEHPPTS
jgi:hypothetical protein